MPSIQSAVYNALVTSPSPLPRAVIIAAVAIAGLAALGALALTVGLPSLRQGRLLEEATEACIDRTRAATTWLDREETVAALLTTERADGAERSKALLDDDAASSLDDDMAALAQRYELELEGLRLGTRRAGDAFDTVPATAVLLGDRAVLPEWLDAFYRQDRVVRLVSFDLELPTFGSPIVQATIRWEFAALPVRAPESDDPTTRWSPPSLVAETGRGRITPLNRSRWATLEEAAGSLRALAPRLRRLAAMDAERALLEEQRLAIVRWRGASAAEAQAVQRRMPELLRRMDLSATGEAALRPGPGGLVVAREP